MCLCLESTCVSVSVYVWYTDNFFLVPYSLQLIMSHSKQNIRRDICSQFAYQIAYLGILEPGSFTFSSTCSENHTMMATFDSLCVFLALLVAFQMPAVMYRGPSPSLDDLFHPLDSQIYQVPQQGQDETLSGQAQVEGKTWTVSFYRDEVMTFQSIVQTPNPVISSSSGVICPFPLVENRQGCFGPAADG